MPRTLAALCLVVAHALPADAADTPKELSGKSVVIGWSEERTQRRVGEPNFIQVKAAHNLSLYVSSAGRIFNRFTSITGAGSGSNEQVAGSDGARRVPTFDGQSMSMTMPFQSGGMRQVDVEFNAAFDGCKAKVIFVKPPGTTQTIGWSPIVKTWIEFKSITPSEANCAVQNGNVFGGN